MKKLVAFDLDDALAVTRKPVGPDMAALLAELAGMYDICIMTGGLYKQLEENVIERLNVTPSLLARFHFMPLNGAQYHHYDIASDKWQREQFVEDLPATDRARIASVLERLAKKLNLWEENPSGPIIADRGTQVTYSGLGQYAKPEDKYAWDPDRTKRTKLLEVAARELPGFEIRINGNTSIDVTRPGIDKGYGIKRLCAMLGLTYDEVLFVGSQSQEGASGCPVKKLGVDVITVENTKETELIIEGLIADRRRHAKGPAFPWGDTPLPDGLGAVVTPLVTLRVSSREDMKQQVRKLLEARKVHVIDTHNTASVLFRFTVDGIEYGLKIEYGPAHVTREEARWYELMPAHLKSHHVLSYISNNYAFVLLKWLRHAKTIEDFAVMGDEHTMDLVLQALNQDKELFESNPTVPLKTSKGSSFFFDKYHSYNAQARNYPYLEKLLDSDTIRINGKEFAGPYRYVQRVQQDDGLRTYLSPDRAGLIHGDSHAGNLLVEDGRVYMIDPKGTSPLPLEYDTGRMHWSLTGWNAIVRGDFRLKEKDGGFELEVAVSRRYLEGYHRFRSHFTEQDYHRTLYSSVMQYLTRMSHAAKQDECLALYLRGLQLFQELFDELGVKV